MSLVNLSHVCSHLTNASKARLGLTSIPSSKLHLNIALNLLKAGFVSAVVRGGHTPPPPHKLLSHPSFNDEEEPIEPVTQDNIASRRLWLGMKYWNSEPVIDKMMMISKPTRRVTLDIEALADIIRGHNRNFVKGLRIPGECMFLSTDRGVMEARECVEKKIGGLALLKALADAHATWLITSVDLKGPCKEADIYDNVSFAEADITSPERISSVLATVKPRIVVHTAGIVPSLNERYGRKWEKKVFSVNVEGTRNVVKAAQEAGVSAFVYTSSCCSVVDDMRVSYANIDERWPTSKHSSMYGESKAYAEELVQAANKENFATCILRPSVLCGPGDYQLVPSIYTCISKRETPFIIGDACNLWDITDVRNIADAHVLAVENLLSTKTAAGEVFFIQNNEPISFRHFSLEIWKNFGHTPPYEVVIPAWLAVFAGLVLEWWTWISGGTTTLSRGSVKDACSMRYASGEKAERILGYEARIGIERSIRDTCNVGFLCKIEKKKANREAQGPQRKASRSCQSAGGRQIEISFHSFKSYLSGSSRSVVFEVLEPACTIG
ncbi:MAG: hypothetical protein Q9227_000677 [Pyrenula ochraceoflavens]